MCQIFSSILGIRVDDVINPPSAPAKKGDDDEMEGESEEGEKRHTHILPNRNAQKWKKVSLFSKIFLRSLLHFCSTLPSHPDMVVYVLRQMEKYLSFFAIDQKMSQRLLKVRFKERERERKRERA